MPLCLVFDTRNNECHLRVVHVLEAATTCEGVAEGDDDAPEIEHLGVLRVGTVDQAPLLGDPRRIALLQLRQLLPEPRVRLLQTRAPGAKRTQHVNIQ